MKKNFVRIVAALLVAMLALTLIPLGALAIEVDVGYHAYDEKKPDADDMPEHFSNAPIDHKQGITSVTIKASNYHQFVEFGENAYDLKGVVDASKYAGTDKDLDPKAYVKFDKAGSHYAVLIYTPHQHKLSYWYSDGTTHWRECLTCKKYHANGYEQFMYQNWCQDGDEDGICNICGGDVPYHDIKVIEVEGAKITLNRDNASHRTKITADVEAEDGYKVGKLHFVKVRDDGSKQEITRYKKNGQFFTYMPTYEMEVSVDVTKK